MPESWPGFCRGRGGGCVPGVVHGLAGSRGSHQPDTFTIILLVQPDTNLLAGQRRHLSAHDVGPDGKLTQAPIDNDQEMHGGRPAEIHECIQSGAGRTSGIEHVIDEKEAALGHIERDAGLTDRRLLESKSEIVPVHRRVQNAHGTEDTVQHLHLLLQATRQVYPSRLHSDQAHRLGRNRTGNRRFENPTRHAIERTIEVALVHELCLDDVLGLHTGKVRNRTHGGHTFTRIHTARIQGPAKEELPGRIPYKARPSIRRMDTQDAVFRYLDPTVVSQLRNMELRARLIVEGFITGLHKSPYHGFSVEFAEHRPYNPGDELRHVDWKVYAKTDRHYVKQYEEETNLRHYVVLDTSSSMRYRGSAALSKLEYGSYLAAALHFLMIRQRDATGLIAFDEAISVLRPPRSTHGYLRELLATLDRIVQVPSETQRTSAATVLHEVAERVGRRSLVVVVTDLFENVGQHDDLIKALRHLRYRGHEVLVFHILNTETERRFDFPDVPMVFRDMETHEEITLQPSQIRENYREAVQHFSALFRSRCRERNIDFVELDTAEPYSTALLAYLNKRSRLS